MKSDQGYQNVVRTVQRVGASENRTVFYAVIVVAFLFLLTNDAIAQTQDYTWKVDSGSNRNWSNSASWAGPSGVPDEPHQRAIFNDPTGMLMPLQNRSMPNGLGQLVFNYTGWTVDFYDYRPLTFNSITHFGYNAINAWASGDPGVISVSSPVEFLHASQNIHTGSGATLVFTHNGFIGDYGPTISSFNPTSTDTGAVRLDTASTTTGAFYLRQGTLLIRNSNALGDSSATVNIGGDQYATNGAYARLLTDASNITVPKNLHVRSYTGSNVNATLGSNHTSGASTYSGNITLDLNTNLTATGTSTVNFTNQITGVGGISKTGSGSVVLGGANNYQGATGVQAGTLRMAAANALPSTTSVDLANTTGALLNLDGHAQSIASLYGGGPSGGNITLGSAQLTVGGGTYSGAISGTGGSIRKTGANTLALYGANSYTGITSIDGGTLLLNGTHTNGGAYTVASEATLGGVGSLYANVNVQNGGVLSPGLSVGTFRVFGNVDLAGTLKIEIDAGGIISPINAIDQLLVNGTLDISAATVDFQMVGTLTDPAYIFASYDSLIGGEFAEVNNPPDGYQIDYNYLGTHQIALIPEPATLAFLGIGALAMAANRRPRLKP